MKTIQVIPAMDIIEGRCVRLEGGDFERVTTYGGDPVETAMRFESAGLKRLHMVDLDGAKNGAITNLDVLRHVVEATSLSIDFSGGIRSDADLESVLAAGASFAAIGSAAVRQPDTVEAWLRKFGPEKFLLGADVRHGRIAISGWQQQTELDLFEHLERFIGFGVRSAFVTDISRDGFLAGPAVELYRQILKRFPDVELIASGGVASADDIDQLADAGCSGVIVGKAIYEGLINLDELKKYAG